MNFLRTDMAGRVIHIRSGSITEVLRKNKVNSFKAHKALKGFFL